jgi:hypothetical protein
MGAGTFLGLGRTVEEVVVAAGEEAVCELEGNVVVAASGEADGAGGPFWSESHSNSKAVRRVN